MKLSKYLNCLKRWLIKPCDGCEYYHECWKDDVEMIPTIEERQVRSCRGCIHYTTVLNIYPKCLLGVVRWDIEDECAGVDITYHTTPCKYHLKRDELKELIDSGGIQ